MMDLLKSLMWVWFVALPALAAFVAVFMGFAAIVLLPVWALAWLVFA